MPGVLDTLRAALYGDPPVPGFRPSRDGVFTAISDLVDSVSGLALGIVSYATVALLPAVTGANNGTTARVYADPTPSNNTFWIVKGGAWVIDVDFVNIFNDYITQASDFADAAALSASTLNVISLRPESGYLATETDIANYAGYVVEPDGTYFIPRQRVSNLAVAEDDATFPVVNRLPSKLPAESGYLAADVDLSGQSRLASPVAGAPYGSALAALGAQESADAAYLVYSITDTSGLRQLRSLRVSDGKVFALTSAGNNVLCGITTDNHVLFWSDASGREQFLCVAIEDNSAVPIISENDVIFAWGNSLFQGTGASGTGPGIGPVPVQLAIMLNRPVLNFGRGGQSSSEIAARQGGAPTLLTVTSNQIPASTAVAVTSYSTDIFQLGAIHAVGFMDGTLAGVAGRLSSDVSGNYTFTRATAGSVVACPANTPFIPDLALRGRGKIQLFEMGENDYTTPTTVLANIAASVAYLSPRRKRFVVLGILNRQDESTVAGATAYNAKLALSASIAAAYPNNYVDTRSPPDTNGFTGELAYLATLGYTPDATDLADISHDTIPTGMRAGGGDILHLNNYGYALQTLRLYNFITAKGWLL